MRSCSSEDTMLSGIIILFPALLPPSMAVTLINKSSMPSSPLMSGCAGQAWSKPGLWDLWTHLDHCVTHVSHRGVCCRAKLLESKPYGQWPGKSCLKCCGNSWVSSILFSWTCVFLCSCLSSDSFQMALAWCKIAKANPRYN